jgi:hypothetical protein
MPKVKNFHEALERDLQRLTAEIKERRSAPEVEKKPEWELVRESLKVFHEEKELPSEPTTGAVEPSSQPVAAMLPSYLQDESTPPEVKLEVGRLIDMIFHEGLDKVIRQAQQQPPFVADAFHDALVDKLLPILKERGII